MAEIRQATDDDIARFYGAIEFKSQWVARALRNGRLIAGFGGALETADGVWFAFLDVPPQYLKPSIYRHIVAGIHEAKSKGAKVIKARCDTRIPRAEALLKHLGFLPTDEVVDNEVIWECQVSN
ncbi:hypothetical protein ASE04_09645 [Rhizobium sp. Root708]|uniref:hypothetical protein n=1 Tax=Rhizobium sp. Root708 TaxID=1736592 RepID=UPI0006FA4A8F|nr:hypothetical protein [Rhizobium sp. Root708]KRB51786.1 hypothetical protein ASE04_09645 [Rhizobium sp. Root708]